MEPYLTIREVAGILRLSEQTIQRYVLKREIPYLKIRKVIRFRPADIEAWAEKGGPAKAAGKDRNREGDLFAGLEAGGTGTVETGTAADGQAGEAGTDGTGENTGGTESKAGQAGAGREAGETQA
jgi:excisionase family DNA binding protein